MLPTPQISFQRTPVTLLVAAAALALEAVCTYDPERRLLYYNEYKLGIWWQIWQGELWRPFTTTLLHGDLLHALFNVYWLATLGPLLENWLGSARTLALVVLLAYVSSLAQYVLGEYLPFGTEPGAGGVVGLSGVVYGLFGVAWAGSWYRGEFAQVCNRDTVGLMLGWLVFCAMMTRLELMHVANLAHTAGLGLGMAVGLAIFQRRLAWAALAVALSLAVLATLVAAPGHPGYEFARQEAAGAP